MLYLFIVFKMIAVINDVIRIELLVSNKFVVNERVDVVNVAAVSYTSVNLTYIIQ